MPQSGNPQPYLFRRPVVGQLRGWAYVPNSTVADFISNSAILSWTLRISSGMTEGICKWMMQSDREFLNIWVSCGQ